jgi:ATP-dependent DNA helicase RecQ
VSRTRLATIVHALSDAGAVEVRDDGRVQAVAAGERLERAVDEAAEGEQDRSAFERSRVEMMRAYAERQGCRRAFLLGYFGEEYDPPCGACDNCDAGLPSEEADASGFGVGERVVHREWGGGTVGQVENGQVTVVFDSVGYRTLDLALVEERGLLTAE